jgi:hypothetical protein
MATTPALTHWLSVLDELDELEDFLLTVHEAKEAVHAVQARVSGSGPHFQIWESIADFVDVAAAPIWENHPAAADAIERQRLWDLLPEASEFGRDEIIAQLEAIRLKYEEEQ